MDALEQLRQMTAERDAVQAELDRLRRIPELRVGQRLRYVVRRVRGRLGLSGDALSDDRRTTARGTTERQQGDPDDQGRLKARTVGEPTSAMAWLDRIPQWQATSFRSVAIQVVLFENDISQQQRLIGGLAATARFARTHLGVERVFLRYGDSSPQRCISDDDLANLRSLGRGVFDEVSYTFFDANLGSSGGSNALAALGDEEVIWVINPDTYPSPPALAELLSTLSVGGVGAAEGRQMPIEHPKDYDPITGATAWVSGFAVAFRREAFDAVHGFDSHFFPMYCDDVDISWRLRLAGWSVRYVPRAVIVHDKPIAAGGSVRWSDEAARSSHLARLWLYRRYGRPDLEAAFLAAVDPIEDPIAADAIAEYRRRVDLGDAPDALAGADEITMFQGGHYAPHRFGYVG